MRNLRINLVNYKIKNLKVVNFLFQNKRIIIPIFLILSYVLFYFVIDFSSQSLVAHDEGLYARRARLLESSDNWFSPPFISPHHKTLGSYWFIALAIRFFGNSELSLRLPSILASFICLFISYLIALKITNRKAALISVGALSSMPIWIQYSRYCSPDLIFVFCILIAILFFLNSFGNTKNFQSYFYIFLSGLFLSFSFFVRSYMAFVPIIGLSPFIIFHLIRKNIIFTAIFSSGILIGSVPTIISLYFSFRKFGIIGITSLFEFAKNQAVGEFHFDNLFLLPVNFLYLTFPVGLLFLLLFVFTRSNNRINYPLLTYCFPFLSVVILLSMSTSYPHYYLFLLPSLSILFSINLA